MNQDEIIDEIIERISWNNSMMPTIKYCTPAASSSINAQVAVNKNYIKEFELLLMNMNKRASNTEGVAL